MLGLVAREYPARAGPCGTLCETDYQRMWHDLCRVVHVAALFFYIDQSEQRWYDISSNVRVSGEFRDNSRALPSLLRRRLRYLRHQESLQDYMQAL